MLNKEILQRMVPFNTMADSNLDELLRAALTETVARGTVLFRQGDKDDQVIYLLDGEVQLTSSDGNVSRTIRSGDDQARYALAQLKPRQVTGKALSNSVIMRVSSELLDRLLTWDQVSGIEVVEMDGGEDAEWMLQVLRSQTFEQLPAENISLMFARMETMPVAAGQVIIKQGDPGDYYYLIREGTCSVAQKNVQGKVAVVNQLGPGDQFGEEALISNAPRNATIIMKTAGTLMRLAKKDFVELLTAPLIDWLDPQAAQAALGAGALVIDVRTEDEFREGALRVSQNVPLYRLREAIPELDTARHYLVCCDTGRRSAVAAFMLSQRGFRAAALKGGLAGLHAKQ